MGKLITPMNLLDALVEIEKLRYQLRQYKTLLGIEPFNIELLKGDKGDKGEKGDPGINGRDGVDGVDGINGTNGTDGVNGVDGISAYQVALNNGFVGNEQEWLNSLKGAAFTYDDFTQEQIDAIKKPALDAAATVNTAIENANTATENANNAISRMEPLITSGQAMNSAESSRITAEGGRVQAEELRVQAEDGRLELEISRVQAETSRNFNENGRITAEDNRISAENSRNNAENLREQNIGIAIINANDATDQAIEASKLIKGYYSSEATLNTSQPSPIDGRVAYVANVASSTGYYIYSSLNGSWFSSTVEAPIMSGTSSDVTLSEAKAYTDAQIATVNTKINSVNEVIESLLV